MKYVHVMDDGVGANYDNDAGEWLMNWLMLMIKMADGCALDLRHQRRCHRSLEIRDVD